MSYKFSASVILLSISAILLYRKNNLKRILCYITRQFPFIRCENIFSGTKVLSIQVNLTISATSAVSELRFRFPQLSASTELLYTAYETLK